MGIYYVDKDAAGTNNGTSWANAWTSIQSALNAVNGWGAGPHTIKVKKPATPGDSYQDDGSGDGTSVMMLKYSGAAGQPIILEGLDRDGTTPAFVPILAATTTACLADAVLAGTGWYVFKNFEFSNGLMNVLLQTGNNLTFKNCRVNYAAMYGVYAVVTGLSFEKCMFNGNGSTALYVDYDVRAVGCIFKLSGEWGLYSSGGAILDHCLFLGNVNGGVQADHAWVSKCTFSGNLDDYPDAIGLDITGVDGDLFMVNSIVTRFGTGVQTAVDRSQSLISCHNAIDGNTVNYVNFATHSNAVTGSLQLVGYEPKASSPCVNVGMDAHIADGKTSYTDVGAVEVVSSNRYSMLLSPLIANQIRRLP